MEYKIQKQMIKQTTEVAEKVGNDGESEKHRLRQ